MTEQEQILHKQEQILEDLQITIFNFQNIPVRLNTDPPHVYGFASASEADREALLEKISKLTKLLIAPKSQYTLGVFKAAGY